MENNSLRITVCNQKVRIENSTFTMLLASHLHYTLGHDVLVVDCNYPQRSIHAQHERADIFTATFSKNTQIFTIRCFGA